MDVAQITGFVNLEGHENDDDDDEPVKYHAVQQTNQ